MKILLFCNCITEDCIKRRKNIEYMAASSRKKLLALCAELENLGHSVDLLSSSFSKHCHWMYIEKISQVLRIIHSPTIGFWGKFSFFKKTISILFHIIWLLFHLRHYQVMIIYNYHMEFSLPALIHKLLSYLKITKKFKLIMDFEDGLFLDKGYQGFLYGTWEKIVYSQVSHYILVNEGLKDRVAKYYPDNKKFVTINGFIDHNLLKKHKVFIKKSIKKIVFSGNFSRGFGFEELLEYVKNLDKDMTLDITGNASKEEIYELKAEIKNSSNIHFHGFLEEKKFTNIIDNADAFILLNDVESPYNKTNFPSKFFDYLSRNKYIITSENPVLKPYYCLENLILLKNFPDDFKRINELKTVNKDNLDIDLISKRNRNTLKEILSND